MDATTALATSGPLLLAALVAVAAGAVSFASPCVVPLVPGYLAYLAGLVGADAPPAREAGRGQPVAGGRGGGAVRRRVHRRVRRDPRRGRVAGRRAGGQPGRAAARRRRRHDRDGAGVRRAHPGAAAASGGVHWLPRAGCGARRCSARCSGWAGCRASGPTLAGVVAVAAGTGGGSLRGVVLTLAYCAGLGRAVRRSSRSFATRAVRALGWLRRHTRGDPDRRRRRCWSPSGCCWSPACGTGGSPGCRRRSARSSR